MIKYTPKLPEEGINTSKGKKVFRRLVLYCFIALVILGAINFCLSSIGEYVAVKYEKELHASMVNLFCNEKTDGKPESKKVQAIVDELLKVHGKPLKIHACVSDKITKEKNAFAAPGPSLVVTSAMYEDLRSGADLSLVIGHEIGHIVHGDSIRAIGRSLGVISIALALSLAEPSDSDVASVVAEILNTNTLKHSRDAEYAADKFGMELFIKAKKDPKPALAYLEKLLLENDNVGLEMSSTHPDSEKRIARLKEMMKN